MNILVIEDDSSIRENLQELLQAHGFEVQSCPDGLAGLAAIQDQIPDLVLCDIMMPKMDGYEVLQALKSSDKTANIPFIYITAKADRADQRLGMELGADDYIIKPFSSKDVLNAIEIRRQKQSSTQKGIQKAVYTKLNTFSKINSHEYNTPLNGIIGLTDVLLDAENKLSRAELTALAQDIKTSAKRLYRTFRNFMLYMQLEREELLEMPTSVINKKWLEDTCKSTLTEKALKLDRVADSHFHSTLTNDFSLSLVKNDLFYSIEELIWNAQRFSQKNTPIGLEITEQKESITISISNHTLPTDFFEQAEPFRQLNRDTQEQQGSGLGIYLCKELAKRNAWELSHAYQNDQSTISLRITT